MTTQQFITLALIIFIVVVACGLCLFTLWIEPKEVAEKELIKIDVERL